MAVAKHWPAATPIPLQCYCRLSIMYSNYHKYLQPLIHVYVALMTPEQITKCNKMRSCGGHQCMSTICVSMATSHCQHCMFVCCPIGCCVESACSHLRSPLSGMACTNTLSIVLPVSCLYWPPCSRHHTHTHTHTQLHTHARRCTQEHTSKNRCIHTHSHVLVCSFSLSLSLSLCVCVWESALLSTKHSLLEMPTVCNGPTP